MRLFVGLEIPDEIRARMRDYVERLKSRGAQAKWTNPEGWHITLKFIGWTKREAEIREALKRISVPRLEIAFRDVGFFTPRQPCVFYVRAHAPETLGDLAKQIDAALVPIGVEAEKKPYSPHLTFARSGSGNPHGTNGDKRQPTMDSLRRLVESSADLQSPQFGTMTANEFILYLSELSPSRGAKYTAVQRYPLGR
jgi:2'-5' RNA ligase